MATNKKQSTFSEIVESHKPKHFKYKYIIKNDEDYEELVKNNYDLDSLDTIQNDSLVQAAINASCQDYPRETVAKAKEPTILDNGIILSKKLVTKADKKLLGLRVGFFYHDGVHYVSIILRYEKFDILEIFILI